jgi:ankyrin repeat domain-containing protein 50
VNEICYSPLCVTLNTANSTLAGAGKTKLSTTVVDDRLRFVKENKSNEAVAYFYCDRNRRDRQNPLNVLRSFVRQLSISRDGERLVSFVYDAYLRHRRDGFAEDDIRYEESTSLLLRLLESSSQTTLVLDGLDECDTDTRSSLIEALDKLIEKSSKLVKIFIASRNDKDLTNRYEGGHNLEIQASDNQQDIELFVEFKMRESTWCRDYMPEEVRQEVLRTFRKKSQGM